MPTVISVEHLSKTYRLGQIGTGTLSRDLNVWWAKTRGKPNPLLRIGEVDQGNRNGDELWALRDVSFTVEQGEVLGIIGRNGAGKSTLLKILSRVTAPTYGKIKVKGRVASLLEVGTGFHPELTGRENIYLNGAILGMSRKEIDRKLDEIVDFAEVEKFIDTPVKRYSSGMYVRLAFAVAAHLDPEILVVDEVLAVGDAAFQKKCLGKIGDVAKEGRTVLFVSHNMAAIGSLCSKSILLENGCLAFSGATTDGISRYVNLDEVSNFIDEHAYFSNLYFNDSNNDSTNELSSSEGFQVNFNINSMHDLTNAVLHFTLRNSQNIVIFQDRHRVKTLKVNDSVSMLICLRIPPLNVKPGGYSCAVKLLAESDGREIRVISKAYPLSFVLNDSHDLSAPGILMPLIGWSIGNEHNL